MGISIAHTGVSVTSYDSTSQSGSPAVFSSQDLTSSRTYTVRAADGTEANYTVTVTMSQGITISGFIDEALTALAFSGVPASPQMGGTLVSITIDPTPVGAVDWYIEIAGPGSPSSYTNNSFSLPMTPGFFSINVIATVGGVPYSGSFGLTVQ
jgi:hypothetical protein